MTRQLNKMLIGEALQIFDFEFGCNITKKMIMQKFRALSLKHHPDKGGDAKIFSKVVEAKEVLLRDFDMLATTTPDANGKPIKSVDSVFVDWLKTADTKNIKNPFTVYRHGKTK